MFKTSEQHRVFSMAWNLVNCMNADHRLARDVISWATENMDILRMSTKSRQMIEDCDDLPRKVLWKEVEYYVAMRHFSPKKYCPSSLEKKVVQVGKLFGLEDLEIDLLYLVVAYYVDVDVHSFLAHICDFKPDNFATVAGLLSTRKIDVQRCLQTESRLVATGLLEVKQGYGQFEDNFIVSDRLIRAVSSKGNSLEKLREELVGHPTRTDLKWNDFDHYDLHRDIIINVLKNATAQKVQGINILLYGPPGTGKTEFCKVVAQKLRIKLFSVGETDDKGNEPSREERIKSLKFTQMLLSTQTSSAILFDEAEDIFSSPFGRDCFRGSKVYIHRLLENNPRPILWTCNNIANFDTSILRRMSVAFEVKPPTSLARERLWTKILAKQQLTFADDHVRILSRNSDTPPALAENAARAARLAGGGFEEVQLLVRGLDKIISDGKRLSPESDDKTHFDPSLVNADTDLKQLSDDLSRSRAESFSLCISGPPGTGKSAYARYLAERLGFPVIQKRASDLLSKWVGDAEKAIAEAFTEAREERSLLIFDEADSLLLDRSDALHSWEISQVNEMLTWMESHPLPFVCTTNIMERIDKASLRRFTFKMQFRYMSSDKAKLAFRSFFGFEPVSGLYRINNLTPGDFAVVRKKIKILNIDNNPHQIVNMLLAECASKVQNSRRTIGFLPPIQELFSR